MKSSTVMKWITGGLEALLAIPLLGGAIIVGFAYIPLFVMLGLHIVTLVLSVNEKRNIYGSVLGIITSVLAWIPFVGWLMHVITAILLMIDASKTQNNDKVVVNDM